MTGRAELDRDLPIMRPGVQKVEDQDSGAALGFRDVGGEGRRARRSQSTSPALWSFTSD